MAITDTEQEIDFGAVFTDFAISVGKGTGLDAVVIKLNDTANNHYVNPPTQSKSHTYRY